MSDNISPEEKLLRLIKGDRKPKAQKTPVDSAPLIKGGGSKTAALGKKIFVSLNLQKLMPVLFSAALIYLLFSIIYPWFALKSIKLPDVSSEQLDEPAVSSKLESKPFESYLQGMNKRQLFSTSQAGAENQEPAVIPAQVQAVDAMKDISLVAIVSGESPQAVIEDKKAQKTYYVTKGQLIGEIQVEDIQEGKIILDYKGKRFELYL